jgi:serine/threonine protein kinase
MRKQFHLNPDWSFERALAEISAVYRPSGYFGPMQRHRVVESWGGLVGRERALKEFDDAIAKYGSITALGRQHSITVPILRELREHYSELPKELFRRARLIPGREFGSWHLIKRIGWGGNAEVWRVRSTIGDAAIKLLKRAKGNSLKRFRAEVELLEKIRGQRGVLPILDHMLPKKSSADWDAWLIMPIAIPVESLRGRMTTLEVVKGIREVAETMARLHSQKIYHRDLKPGNLLLLKGRWVVSDFGIASFPGKEALTVPGQKLGPIYFVAPEMLFEPEKSRGDAADVYSLAKTLWVLLSDQKYPPPGEHRTDNDFVRIEKWVSQKGIDSLNEVFERCTFFSPEKRMTMADFVASLDSWLEN